MHYELNPDSFLNFQNKFFNAQDRLTQFEFQHILHSFDPTINTQYNYYSIYLIGGTGGGRKAGLRSYGSSFAPLEPEEPDEFNWDWEIFGYVMLALSGKI